MRCIICVLLGLFFIKPLQAQESSKEKLFIFGTDGGIGASYTDKALLLSIQGSFTMDYSLKDTWALQIAPRYTWLILWNEHYLTIPLHLKKRLSDRLSAYMGPALTFDIGYFKDLGISAGIYYHLGKRSAINFSFFTFTLYDYHIDYLFIPIGLTYHYTFLK